MKKTFERHVISLIQILLTINIDLKSNNEKLKLLVFSYTAHTLRILK